MSYFPTAVLGEIQAIYSQNPIRPRQTDHIELEVRFGEYSIPPRQVPFFNKRTQRNDIRRETRREITQVTFNKFLEKLTDDPTITDVTDCTMGDIRRSIDNQTKIVSWIRKKSLLREDNHNYRIRIAMSSEEPINEVTDFKPTYTRRKLRRSYDLPTGFRLDLTEVTSGQDDDLTKSYEVEIEAMQRNVSFDNIMTSIHYVLLTIQDTKIVYTNKDYFDIIDYVNTSLEGREMKRLDDKVLYQPRNLHFKDLVYGGIVGNPNEIYKVTWKTDGIRKLLVMSKTGLWLVWAPSEVNLLTRWYHHRLVGTILEGEYVPLDRRFLRHQQKDRMKYTDWLKIRRDPNSDKSLIEGYTLTPSQEYWFLGFDALARPFDGMSDRGDKTIQAETHRDRMNTVQFFKDIFYSVAGDDERINDFLTKTFNINTKKFEVFKNPPEFFSIMREFNALVPTLAYDIDGYIFTPDNMAYDSGNDKKPLSRRVLTKLSDICKYKPANDMTIDFEISWKEGITTLPPLVSSCSTGSINPGTSRRENPARPLDEPATRVSVSARHLELLVSEYDPTTRRSKSVPFKGTFKKSLTDDIIDIDNPLTQNVPSGTIVEYRWDDQQEKLTPLRIRHDKIYPNRIEVADDNWDLIFVPIQLDVLLGNTTQLVRNYHNRIKKDLFTQAARRYSKRIGSGRKPYLLDIGSGRGGDIFKWKDYDKIIAVEPNLDHIQSELIPRIRKNLKQLEVVTIANHKDIETLMPDVIQRNDRIIVVKSGGQDTDLITAVTSRFLGGIGGIGETGGKVDVVSMMLSLSFFWESSMILDSLIKTITTNLKSNGEFIFMTVNGDTVEEIFNPKFGNGPQIDQLFMGPRGDRTIEMKLDIPTRKVWINMPGTIVEDQTEWLVKADDLQIRLDEYGFSIRSLERADKEGFLTQAERVFTNMYSYGSFTASAENQIPRVTEVLTTAAAPQIVEPSKIEIPATPPEKLVSPKITPPSTPPQVTTPPSIVTVTSTPMALSPQVSSPVSVLVTEETVKSPDIGADLPYLPVNTGSTDAQGRAVGDDVTQIIPCQWYQEHPVVRIAAIGDGSCFIHSVLKAYLLSYANNPAVANRVKLARELRRDMAFTLQLPDPTHPGMTFYQSFNNGIFVELSEGDKSYTLANLQKIINSPGWLGDEIFNYTTQRLGVNVVVTTPTTTDLVQESGGELDQLRHPYNIFIGHAGGCHYETIGIYIEGKGIQTVFDINDPFLIAYHSNRTLNEIRSDVNTIIEKIKLYQNDIFQQAVGIDINEFLRTDDTFIRIKNQLADAKDIFARSQDLQEKAVLGSNMETLQQLLQNKDRVNQIQKSVSGVVG